MKSLLRNLLLLAVLITSAVAAQAQPFKSAVGLRLGSPLAVSYKQHISDAGAFEIYGGIRGNSFYRWVSVSGAYQQHYDLGLEAELAPLRWYWGAGATAYFFSYKTVFGFDNSKFSSTAVGLNGYLGLDYTFSGTPINLSVDWVPTIFLGNSYISGFGAGYGSLAVRYVLGQ